MYWNPRIHWSDWIYDRHADWGFTAELLCASSGLTQKITTLGPLVRPHCEPSSILHPFHRLCVCLRLHSSNRAVVFELCPSGKPVIFCQSAITAMVSVTHEQLIHELRLVVVTTTTGLTTMNDNTTLPWLILNCMQYYIILTNIIANA